MSAPAPTSREAAAGALPPPARVHTRRLDNGLQLLVEPIPGVQSVAAAVLLPGGLCRERADRPGTANLLSNLMMRGAGDRDGRRLLLDLDHLGVQHAQSTGVYRQSLRLSCLPQNLLPALEVFADVLRRPALAVEPFEQVRQMALYELAAVEDDPGQKLSIELRRRALPDPLGRSLYGSAEGLRALTVDDLRELHGRTFVPDGSVVAVAGAVQAEQALDALQRLLGDWHGGPPPPLSLTPVAPTTHHIHGDKVQTHVGITFPAVDYADPHYFNAHGVAGILGGGMSSRLFEEVREKRGLCYSVGASFAPMKHLGRITIHASSRSERVLETLRVIHGEVERLADGVGEDEVRRLRAGLKSSLVMAEESTSARAGILARSWMNLGRVRTVAEVADEIDRIQPATIADYLQRHPPRDFVVVTLGPQTEMQRPEAQPVGVSA